jgi:hypothetical protein
MDYKCKRCGYETDHKHCLYQHFDRKKQCNSIINDIDISILRYELDNIKSSEGNFQCIFCERQFVNRNNMYKHKKICKKKPNEISLQDQINELRDKINNNLTPIIQNNNNEQLKLELQYYKNRKNENFYQLLLENYLGSTHKTLSCGITDITTDTCHAEIKEWPSWKESIGQLFCYNASDPKETLEMYMFGKYTQKCKDEAVKIAASYKINVYEFVDTAEGVSIISLKNNEEIYKYKPE